jgi:hypothetical protein
MARLYDWDSFLTAEERAEVFRLGGQIVQLKHDLSAYQAGRDAIRRKAVQRARNALNKRARAALREKG